MSTFVQTDPRPEAMADVPGVCEILLTRAVVQYRDVHEIDLAGGRIEDIGLALVMEGRFASSAEVVDLGSASVKHLDLSAELVVLDWVYEPTLEHVHDLLRRSATGDAEGEARRELGRFSSRLGLRVLERVGFGPLSRPTLLRIGFRDVCRDLDLHEGTSVRIALGPGRIVRTHLDYDANALVFRTGSTTPDPELEAALREAFPDADLRRFVPESRGGSGGYQVRFALPLGLDELRTEIRTIRDGLVRLLTRFESERFRSVERVVETFGQRETLARLNVRRPGVRYDRVPSGAPGTVH